MGSFGFFIELILPIPLRPCGRLHLYKNDYQGYLLLGKDSQFVGLTTLPPSCAECLDIWEPQPPGSLWACPGLYRDLLYFNFQLQFPHLLCPFFHPYTSQPLTNAVNDSFTADGSYILDTLIYLFTAIGLTPGGRSTVHIYTQTIHRTTQ
jgi:hypothetical protein